MKEHSEKLRFMTIRRVWILGSQKQNHYYRQERMNSKERNSYNDFSIRFLKMTEAIFCVVAFRLYRFLKDYRNSIRKGHCFQLIFEMEDKSPQILKITFTTENK